MKISNAAGGRPSGMVKTRSPASSKTSDLTTYFSSFANLTGPVCCRNWLKGAGHRRQNFSTAVSSKVKPVPGRSEIRISPSTMSICSLKRGACQGMCSTEIQFSDDPAMHRWTHRRQFCLSVFWAIKRKSLDRPQFKFNSLSRKFDYRIDFCDRISPAQSATAILSQISEFATIAA